MDGVSLGFTFFLFAPARSQQVNQVEEAKSRWESSVRKVERSCGD